MDTALVLAIEDSTAQKVTLIVIGLLLAALALAVLTVWYYRITDPGPKPGIETDNPGSGPKPGWKARLSNIQLPSVPIRSPKTKTPPSPAPPKPTPVAEVAQPKAATPAPERVSLEGGYYLDLSESTKIAPPGTNVGSLSSVDLREPAPQSTARPKVSVQQASKPRPQTPQPKQERQLPQAQPETQAQPVRRAERIVQPRADDELSFDEWLTALEASDEAPNG